MSANCDLIKEIMECSLTEVNANQDDGTTLHHKIAKTDIPMEQLEILQQRGANFNAVDDRGLSVLSIAISCGRSNDCVKNLIKFGADPKAADQQGITPLHLAVEKGNLELATFLVSEGVDVNAVSETGGSPLRYAFHELAAETKVPLAKLLLSNGAYIQAKRVKMITINSPAKLMMNMNNSTDVPFELMQVLKECGADFDCTDEDAEGRSLIYLAISKNCSMDLIRNLVEMGADPKKANNKGQTPLFVAVDRGYVDAAEYLISVGCDVNVADFHCFTPLHIAVLTTASSAPMTKLLLSKGANVDAKNDRGETPVGLAGRHLEGTLEFFKILEILKEYGADFNSLSSNGISPLSRCIFEGRSPSLLQKLVDLGADSKFVLEKENNMTMLHLAVINLDLDTANWLLSVGADINKKDTRGDTALGYALDRLNEDKSYEMIEFLSERGINLNSTENKRGFTILHRLTLCSADLDMSKIFGLLKKHGADFNALDNKQRPPLQLAMAMGRSIKFITSLLDNGADPKITFTINGTITHRFTSLLYAATENNLELVKLLISRGCDVNVLDDPFMQTPLHAMMVNPKKQDKVCEITKLLLANGADPNIKDGSGNTVLDEALTFGKVERSTMFLLVENGGRVVHDNSMRSFMDLLIA